MVTRFDKLCFNQDSYTYRLLWLSSTRGLEDSFRVKMFKGALSITLIRAAFRLDP